MALQLQQQEAPADETPAPPGYDSYEDFQREMLAGGAVQQANADRLAEIDPNDVGAIARERERQQSVGEAGAFGRGVGEGASFGFGDELVGGLGWAGQGLENLVTGQQEGDLSMEAAGNIAREASRGRQDAAREQRGGAYLGGNIAGGVATALVPVGAVASIGARGVQGANAARTGWQTARLAAGIGAAEGAVAGFGTDEGDFMDRLDGAMIGAGVGAIAAPALGAALPAAGAAIRMGGRGIRQVGQWLRPSETKAAEFLGSAARASGLGRVLPGNVADQAAAAAGRGAPSNAQAEVGSAPMGNLLNTASGQIDEAGAFQISNTLAETAGQGPQRVAAGIDGLMGRTADDAADYRFIDQAGDAIERDWRPQIREAYAELDATPVNPTVFAERMRSLFQNPDVASAAASAGRFFEAKAANLAYTPERAADAQAAREAAAAIASLLSRDGTATEMVPPSTALEAIRRFMRTRMDAVAESPEPNVRMEYEAMRELYRGYIGAFDAATGGISSKGTQLHRQFMQQNDLLMYGMNSLRRVNADGDIVMSPTALQRVIDGQDERFGTLGPGDIEALQQGLASQLHRMAASNSTGLANRLGGNADLERSLIAVFGPERSARFLRDVLRPEISRTTMRNRAGVPNTVLGVDAARGPSVAGVVGHGLETLGYGAMGRPAAAIGGLNRSLGALTGRGGISPRTAQEIANLAENATPEQAALIQRFMDEVTPETATVQADRLMRDLMMMGGGIVGSRQIVRQNSEQLR